MAVTVGTFTSAGAGSSTTINKPANTASGDLLVLWMRCRVASTAPTAPAGWTSITSLNAQSEYVAAAYLVAGASEPASYTWTAGTGSGWNSAYIIRCTGQDATTPIDGNTTGSSSTASASLSALTASVAGDALLMFVADWNDTGVSSWPLSGSTLTSDLNTDDQQAGDATNLASGSTGAMTITFNSANTHTVIAVLVKSAGGGGGGTTWNQSVSDSHSGLDLIVKQPGKLLLETQSALDLRTLTTGKTLVDTHSGTDAKTLQVLKALTEYHSGRDSKTLGPGKYPSDAHSAADTLLPKSVTKTLADAFAEFDLLSKMPAKTFIERFSQLDSVTTQHFSGVIWTRTVTDAHSALDVVKRVFTKLNTDAWSAIDAITRAWVAHLLVQEYVSLTDFVIKQVSRTQTDTTSETESHLLQTVKDVLDSVSSQDLLNRAMTKVLPDGTSGTDQPIKLMTHGVFDSFSQTDRVTIARGILLKVLDALSLTDNVLGLQNLRPGIRFPLEVVTSLVASAFNITVTMTTAGNLTNILSLLPATLANTPQLLDD